MALNFVETTRIDLPANKFLPVSNPINITLNSTNNGKCNFRYVCDIYIGALFVFRFKLFPDPATGWAYFQLSDVLNDYLESYMPTNNTASIAVGTSATSRSAALIQLKFGEEYDNSVACDGDIITYPNLLSSNTFWVFLGAIDYSEWPEWNWEDYTIKNYATTSNVKFLTNRREDIEVRPQDSYYLDILSGVAPTPGTTRVSVTTNLGTTASFSSPTLSSVGRYKISCGPHDINRALSDAFINLNIDWYDIKLVGSAGDLTETIRFHTKAGSPFMTRIGFVGQLGSTEYYTFFHRKRSGYDIERKNYKKGLTSVKGNSLSYSVGDRELTTWGVNAQKQSIVSSFVSSKTSEWLGELWLSNNVWNEIRPRYWEVRVFREDQTPTSRMLFWFPDNHGLVAGNQFFMWACKGAQYGDYNNLFTIVSQSGNIIDCGLTFNIYNLTDSAAGWAIKNEVAMRIPIVPTDSGVELKEKTGKQLEWTLQWVDSVNKITIR